MSWGAAWVQTFQIYVPPEVLVVHLGREYYDGSRKRLAEHAVSYPDELDLRPHMTEAARGAWGHCVGI